MAKKLSFSIEDVPGSQLISLLKGLSQIFPELVRPAVYQFRAPALGGATLTFAEPKHIQSDVDFVCNELRAAIMGLSTENLSPAMLAYFNVKESSKGRDWFDDAMPFSLLIGPVGGTAGAAYPPSIGYYAPWIMQAPYVFGAGNDIRVTFTADAALATARPADLFLLGFNVSTNLEITEREARKILAKKG